MEFYLNAELYHLSDAHERFELHPEGVPRIARNCLLLGQQGVGKSIVLKELCYRHRESDNILPLYIPIESWINQIRAEMAYPRHTPVSPHEQDVIACTEILLSLALIETTHEHSGYEYVEKAISLFPSHLSSKVYFDKWKNDQLSIVRSVLEDGRRLSPTSSSFPTVYNVANTIGKAVSATSKTVLFLVDGVDKISLVQFEGVRSLLNRGEYLAVIATRPCPCAPDPSVLPSKVILGNDYDIHWLGKNPRSQKWRDFARDVLRGSPLDEKAIEIAIANLKSLTSLAGASVRTILRICSEIEFNIQERKSDEEAWNESIMSLINEEKRIAGEVMGAWCLEEPDRIIKFMVEKATVMRQEEGKQGPGPAILCISKSQKLFLDEKILKFLRVCVREGIFIPLNPALEPLPDDYEINPLLTIPDEHAVFSALSDETCKFYIECKKFKYWVKEKPSGGPPGKKKVFVPYWMSAPEKQGVLAQRLRERAFRRFEILTGEDTYPGQWSPEIKKLLKQSHVVTCDLTVPRRDVYVELGLAIGLCKQVLLGCETREEEKRNPGWVLEQKIYPFGSDSDFDSFLCQLLRMLDIFPDRVATWLDSPSYEESINYKPSPTYLVLIGHGNAFCNVQEICKTVAQEHKLFFEQVLSESGQEDVRHGGILYDIIPLARRAGTLVLLFDGTESDFLTCVAGGIFASRDFIRVGKKSCKRKLFLINFLGPNSKGITPGLLESKPKVNIYYKIDEFKIEIRDHISTLNRWLSDIILETRRSVDSG